MLNKSKGQMYLWVTHTWNVIKGKCPHDCSYCYMKRYPQPELHFDEKELKTDLGSGNFIFVGSSCDDWAEAIPLDWIDQIWQKCLLYPKNRYLFQSKNPLCFLSYQNSITVNALWGTTIESNRCCCSFSPGAPCTSGRYLSMKNISLPKMVSIEPIMDFDLLELVRWMREIEPQFVSIGADSGNNHLPEPSSEKVKALIEGLREFTEVKVKDNLKRLLK